MKEENFKKGLEEISRNKPSMTVDEEVVMLSKIFSAPIESPYMVRSNILGFTMTRRLQFVLVASLIFILSTSSVVYASGGSLPGDLLYPIKVSIVEPVLDVVNSGKEKEVEWAEEKIIRRIEEAEKLAEKDKLGDKQVEAIEKRIKKESDDFVKILNKDDKFGSSKIEEFKKKVYEERRENEKEDEDEDSDEDKEKDEESEEYDKSVSSKQKESEDKKKDREDKIKKLKDTAIKVVEDRDKSDKSKDRGREDD